MNTGAAAPDRRAHFTTQPCAHVETQRRLRLRWIALCHAEHALRKRFGFSDCLRVMSSGKRDVQISRTRIRGLAS